MKTILLIDDNHDFRETISDMLQRKHYQVLQAADGNEGLSLYHQNNVDLVITDILMPEKDGISVIFDLYNNHPSAKVIAISGGGQLSGTDYLSTLVGLNVEYTFTKPLDRDAFFAAIDKLLGDA